MTFVPLSRLSQLVQTARIRGAASELLDRFLAQHTEKPPTPTAIRRALAHIAARQARVDDIAAKRALAWCAHELRRLLPAESAQPTGRAALRIATVADDRRIPAELLHVTPQGGVVYLGAPGADGKPRNLVLRAVPWVVKELFALGGATVFVTAGARLQAGTGMPGTDCEFPGYMGKFVRGAQAHIITFDDEIASTRRILEISYLGASWGIKRSTIAALYPPGHDVPDLHAEARALESDYPLDGPGGVWEFHGVSRRGEVTVEGFTLRHLGDARWRIFDTELFVGDIDLADYPLPVSVRPQFMEAVIGHPERMRRRAQALIEGRPMRVSLGGGSGFTAEKSSCHIEFDGQGDATLVDPNIDVVNDLIRLGIPLDRVKRINVTHVHFDHVAGVATLIRHVPHKPELWIHANAGDIEAIRAGHTDGAELSTLRALLTILENQSHGEITGAQWLDAVTVVPLRFQTPVQLGTVTAEFFHTAHSHPTTAYRLRNAISGQPATLFTGDSRLCADKLRAMQVDGHAAMSDARIAELSQQVAQTLLAGGHVFADAGVTPLHPTLEFYPVVRAELAAQGLAGEALEAAMARLHLYHESAAKITGAGFRDVGWGWDSAVDQSPQLGWVQPLAEVIETRLRQRGVRRVPLLAHLPGAVLDRLEQMGTVRHMPAGTIVMREGAIAQQMYLLLDGAVTVSKQLGDRVLTLETLTGGLLGEGMLSRERVRNATVTAASDVWCVELGADAISFLQEQGIAARLVELRDLRTLIDGSTGATPILANVGAAVRDAILLHADTVLHRAGATIIREGDADQDLYVVLTGQVQMSAQGGPLAQRPVLLQRGAVFGEGALLARGPRPARMATVMALTDVQLFRVSGSDAQHLLAEHGGDLQLFLQGLVQERRAVAQAAVG